MLIGLYVSQGTHKMLLISIVIQLAEPYTCLISSQWMNMNVFYLRICLELDMN